MPWPITAPAYGTYNWFAIACGIYLDYGADFNGWDHEQAQRVDWFIQSGVRQFYFPPLLPEQKQPYEWSFLKVTATLALSDTDWDYDLPADFGTILDDVSFALASAKGRVEIVSPATVMALQDKADAAGVPKYMAIRPKAVAMTAAQAWEAIFYPTPNASLTLTYRYNVAPADMSVTNLYPLGTKVHTETILQSIMAVAELRTKGQQGPMHAAFLERLVASIQLDARSSRNSEMTVKLPDLAKSAA